MNEIKIESLAYRYENEYALNNISFSIDRGEVVSIIGPNGSGKSTLLKIINNIYSAKEGQVYIKNRKIGSYKTKELSKILSYVPQNTIIDYDFSVYEIVLMGRYPYKNRFEKENEEDHRIVKESMELTNTYYLKDRSIRDISGGERQRVLIAKAIAQKTDIILLDEPTSQLDINHEIEIFKLIKRLNEEEGKTIIMAIHDIDLSSRFSNKIVILKSGRLYKVGKPEEVIVKKYIEEVYKTNVEIDKNKYLDYLELTVL